MKPRRGTIAHLTKYNQGIFFGIVKEPDRPFTYSELFLLDEVKQLAYAQDIAIEYQPPRSDLYRDHGCFTCKVVGKYSKLNGKGEQTFLFDPEELVL